MKYVLVFLLFISFHSSALFRDCFKPQAQVDQEHIDKLTEIAESNRKQPTRFTVSIKHKDDRVFADEYPDPWPKIQRTIDYSELKTKQWLLLPTTDSACRIEVCGPKVTCIPCGGAPQDYKWSIRPCAVGTAIIKVQYAKKNNNQVEDEQTITITITD